MYVGVHALRIGPTPVLRLRTQELRLRSNCVELVAGPKLLSSYALSSYHIRVD
jgi:hypothetical protein